MRLRAFSAARRRASGSRLLTLRCPTRAAGVLAILMVAAVLQVPSVVSLAPIARADDTPPKAAATEQEALKAAAESGEPVEVLAERGESRTVRALPNGRMEVEEHIRPIRTRKDGEWADIDTTLHRSGDAVVPGATTVGLTFSGGGSGTDGADDAGRSQAGVDVAAGTAGADP